MAVPSYDKFLTPVMQYPSGKEEAHINELQEETATILGVEGKDRLAMLPSGRQAVYQNRAGWAVTYLKKAGLIENTRRGWYKISEKGHEIFGKNKIITLDILQKFKSFRDFKENRTDKTIVDSNKASNEQQSPQDKLDEAFGLIQQDLQDELLEKLKSNSPAFFEQAVLHVLSGLGYGGGELSRTEVVGKPGDEGIDGIIREDTLGLEMIYVQAKRWQGSVGRPEVQKFVGAMQGQRAKKGVIITTGSFTADAHSYASSIDMKVVLIDGDQLTRYMIDKNVGVSTVYSYHIKRLDSDYFEE